MRHLKITRKSWPVAGSFRISRSTLTDIEVVTVEITDGNQTGRGECRPYARYNETPESVMAEIELCRADIEAGLSLEALQTLMPPGAARNAVDCALWDLNAKQSGKTVSNMLGLPPPKSRTTAYTLSIDTPEDMANAARAAKAYPILKLKIGNTGGLAACKAVIEARPDAVLFIDANEALSPKELPGFLKALQDSKVAFIEQPVGQKDQIPSGITFSPPLCADESLHTREDLLPLWDAGYRVVNVKLDKTGGLSEAVALMLDAKAMGFKIMAGCMVGTSLAMAPMMMLESLADYIDLDGPLLLEKDIEPSLCYEGASIAPPSVELWG